MRRIRFSVPTTLVASGILMVVGAIVATGVHNAVEKSDGIHPHNFNHGASAAVGAILILGIVLIVSGALWVIARRRERQRARKFDGARA